MSDEDFARWDALEAEVLASEGPPVAAEGSPVAAEGEDPASLFPPPPPPSPAQDPAPPVEPPVADDRPTVLLVDGDVTDRNVLAEALRAQGWTTRVATDGPEALIELYRHPPDCIILDLVLDGMGGLALLARIQDDGVVEGLCVVVHSSVSESMHVHQARALGADRFLDRDMDHPEALVEVVRDQFIQRGLAVPTAPEEPAETAGDPSGLRSSFGRGGGPPGSVPRAVKQAALGRVPTD